MKQPSIFNKRERQEGSYLMGLVRDASRPYARSLRLLGESFGGGTFALSARLCRDSFPIHRTYLLPQYYLGVNSESAPLTTAKLQRPQQGLSKPAEAVVLPRRLSAQTPIGVAGQGEESALAANVPKLAASALAGAPSNPKVDNSISIHIPERGPRFELNTQVKPSTFTERVVSSQRSEPSSNAQDVEPTEQLNDLKSAQTMNPVLEPKQSSETESALLESIARYKAQNVKPGAGQSLAHLTRYLEAHNFGESCNPIAGDVVRKNSEAEADFSVASKTHAISTVPGTKAVSLEKIEPIALVQAKSAALDGPIHAKPMSLRARQTQSSLNFTAIKPLAPKIQEENLQLTKDRPTATKAPEKVIVKKKIVHVAASELAPPAFWERSYMSHVHLRLYR